jgi:hydroxymethylglutaryl-CoA reductase
VGYIPLPLGIAGPLTVDGELSYPNGMPSFEVGTIGGGTVLAPQQSVATLASETWLWWKTPFSKS